MAEKKKWKKGIFNSIKKDIGWEVGYWDNPDGKSLLSLNKLTEGRRTGTITLNKLQLKNLKRFMKELKIE